jgi:hypothetical protein
VNLGRRLGGLGGFRGFSPRHAEKVSVTVFIGSGEITHETHLTHLAATPLAVRARPEDPCPRVEENAADD